MSAVSKAKEKKYLLRTFRTWFFLSLILTFDNVFRLLRYVKHVLGITTPNLKFYLKIFLETVSRLSVTCWFAHIYERSVRQET